MQHLRKPMCYFKVSLLNLQHPGNVWNSDVNLLKKVFFPHVFLWFTLIFDSQYTPCGSFSNPEIVGYFLKAWIEVSNMGFISKANINDISAVLLLSESCYLEGSLKSKLTEMKPHRLLPQPLSTQLACSKIVWSFSHCLAAYCNWWIIQSADRPVLFLDAGEHKWNAIWRSVLKLSAEII